MLAEQCQRYPLVASRGSRHVKELACLIRSAGRPDVVATAALRADANQRRVPLVGNPLDDSQRLRHLRRRNDWYAFLDDTCLLASNRGERVAEDSHMIVA